MIAYLLLALFFWTDAPTRCLDKGGIYVYPNEAPAQCVMPHHDIAGADL